MRRILAGLAVGLVLVAWTCAPTGGVSPGSPGATVASGVTTTGLTSLLTGEDWHYVGETGEPAFANSWDNYLSTSPALAFRIRESGVVDIQGVVSGGTPGLAIFTLPVGYRPNSITMIPSIGAPPSPDPFTLSACYILISSSGIVTANRLVAGGSSDPGTVFIYAQVFLDAPVTPADL